MTLKTKIGAAVAAGSFLVATMLPAAAFADQSCTIRRNGADSYNRCRINIEVTRKIRQVNFADVDNHVSVHSSTGGNDANLNTGGDVSIISGNSTVRVTIVNLVNANVVVPTP